MPTPVGLDWIDPLFNQPFVDCDEHRDGPVPHRYVSGGFAGTQARFSFYFPPADEYDGRFFHNTYPMATTSDIGPFPIEFEVATGDLGFTFASFAAYVQTNNGGVFRDPATDPAIPAWRVNAAAAKYFRAFSQEVYGPHKLHGYLFGGSGGAYQTMGAAEATSGIWDGFVPFVSGCNHAIPSMFTARMHALRTLGRHGRFPALFDAIDVGGSGDPLAVLDGEEEAAYLEAAGMGFPAAGWYCHQTMGSGYFANISGMIPAMDPTYADDFWSKPGYLGSDPNAAIRKDRFSFDTTVTAVDRGPPASITLAAVPDRDFANAHLVLGSGASLPIARHGGTTVTLIAHVDPSAVASIQPGDSVRIDNSWALALETYHRHQVPPTTDYLGWNQFRDDAGRPIYPQRPVQIGPVGTMNSAGHVLDGQLHGKAIVLGCLLDIDCHPWQSDWYRGMVRKALGKDVADDNLAVQYVERAHHENPLTPLARQHAISYSGALQQALHDLAAWVENDEVPPQTHYSIVGAQVVLPATANARGGSQPVITLAANGGARAEVRVGEPVTFTAAIEVPMTTGDVVAAEWDFDQTGEFAIGADFTTAHHVELTASYSWSAPGTYFVALRAHSHREGDVESPYCRIANLARVRVVVK
ncbi:MAG: PKD domain-containing protein [Sphingomonadales bacterium]|nr:PKD domain-containing protein [Sphingomonadales bacterium]